MWVGVYAFYLYDTLHNAGKLHWALVRFQLLLVIRIHCLITKELLLSTGEWNFVTLFLIMTM